LRYDVCLHFEYRNLIIPNSQKNSLHAPTYNKKKGRVY